MKRFATIATTACLAASGWAQQTTPPAAAAPSSWADKVTVKGDVRYRYETVADDAKGDYTRQRDRVRARLGADAKVSDTLKGGVALSTGQNDPVSGNQSIGDGFQKKEFKLDLAYLDWMFLGSDPNTLSLVAGKFKNPFGTILDRTVMDLVWDPDLTTEGASLQGQAAMGMATFRGNAGYLWTKERDKENDDTVIYVGQGAAKFQFVPEFYLTVGASYYDFNRMQGFEPLDWEGKGSFYGNSSMDKVSGNTTNKVYKYAFTPLEFFAEAGAFVGTFPVTVYGQTVNNSKADEFDKGYLAGITLGKAKNPKTFEVGYRYAELEKNAVVGAFTDSDRWGGGTDGKGNRFHGRYQINKNLQVGLTYFIDDKVISDDTKTKDYKRLQADLIFAF